MINSSMPWDAGFRAAEEDGLAKVGVCLSVMRQQTAREGRGNWAEWMVDRRHPRVVALSIDGNEASLGRNELKVRRGVPDRGRGRTEASGPCR